ncbi:MAG: hypothetical protein MUF34_04010 [Polyangiaceae bacterium]|jgi:hypothetical protein|nr:hypothetical protein [Polyangiaceae bacterium]
MTFGRILAGLVVSGWLMAGASCAETGADAGDANEREPTTDTTRLAAQNPPGVPTQQPTNPQIPMPPYLSPRLSNPTGACSTLLPNSTFKGYLVERNAGSNMCPDIQTSLGTWVGSDIDLSPGYSDMYVPQDSFFVSAKTANTCLYLRDNKPPFYIPTPTAAQYYNALLTALNYPNNPTRDMLGLVCEPVAPAVTSNISGIPMCRKCAVAHESAIKL